MGNPLSELKIAGCLRDSSPGGWGRRVISNFVSNNAAHANDIDHTSELLFFLVSGSNRIGSFDFQHSGTEYRPRLNDYTTLQDLIGSVERVEQQTQSLHHRW